MAKFDYDVDNGILKNIENMGRKAPEVIERMVDAGADAVLRNVRANMRSSYKSTRSLEAGLGKTKPFKTPSTDGIAVKVGFRGYSPTSRTKKFSNGVPVPLIAIAREKGTKRGERAKPFFKKSFNRSMIEAEMRKVEPKLFEGMN